MYDIAVLGLGPAGATLCRLLNKGLRVIAIDKKQGDEGFHKPCGGLLAPDAQKALARFNMTLPKSVLTHPQIFSVRTVDVKANITKYYQRFYMNLDRHKFDLWLMSLIPDHIEVHSGARCISVAPMEGGGYRVVYREEETERIIEARHIVGADGAASMVRKALYPKVRIRSYVAIQQWFHDQHPNPFYSCVFDSDSTDCYAWGVSKEGYFLFGGAFPPKNAREGFERLKEKVKTHGFALCDPVKTECCLVLSPNGLFDTRSGKKGAFLVGEAAGFISPSSLEGVSYALKSAYALSRVLNAGGSNHSYWRATLPIRVKLLLKNCKSPFLYFPPLRYLVMKSGLKTISLWKEK